LVSYGAAALLRTYAADFRGPLLLVTTEPQSVALPTLVRGLHVAVKPCSRSSKELALQRNRHPGRATLPTMPSKPFIDDR
jgi:hypothetical protein